MSCDVQVKRLKGWRMSCDVGKATQGLENELWRRWSDGKVGEWAELIKEIFKKFENLCCKEKEESFLISCVVFDETELVTFVYRGKLA